MTAKSSREGRQRAGLFLGCSQPLLPHTLPSRSVPYVQVEWTGLTGLIKDRTPPRWAEISGKRFRLPPAVEGRAGTPTPGMFSNRPRNRLSYFNPYFLGPSSTPSFHPCQSPGGGGGGYRHLVGAFLGRVSTAVAGGLNRTLGQTVFMAGWARSLSPRNDLLTETASPVSQRGGPEICCLGSLGPGSIRERTPLATILLGFSLTYSINVDSM
ncbi:hypothetical protein LZ31DRAFT_214993 [Colletotrichum somersetense]|nr:hypothetical protein LZ31DRAFT_214993 [Colletotrichum somersetense]